MRVQTYRTKIQNGVISKRRNRPAVTQAGRRPERKRRRGREGERERGRERGSGSSPRSRRSGASGSRRSRQRGANVLWMLMLVGALLACGFVFAMRSKINVYQLGQSEAQLKNELDEMANRQRYEMLERERALSPSKIDRAAKQAGLVQPALKVQNNAITHESKKQKTSSKKSL